MNIDTKRANTLLNEVIKIAPENEKLLNLQESLRSLS